MSDTDLRALERQFRASRDPSDEARWLSAALGAGRIAPTALELAAHVGHEPASAALGRPLRPPAERLDPEGFAGHDWQVVERAKLGLSRWCADRLSREARLHRRAPEPALWARMAREQVQAQEEGLLRGCQPTTTGVPEEVRAQVRLGWELRPSWDPAVEQLLQTLRDSVATPGSAQVFEQLPPELRPEFEAAVQAELVPWLLHGDDPIVARQGLGLDTLELASPCEADWDAMEGDDRVRFCGACQLHVFDLSALEAEEALELVRGRAGRLCVRMTKRADGKLLTQDCPRGLDARLEPHREMVMMGSIQPPGPQPTSFLTGEPDGQDVHAHDGHDGHAHDGHDAHAHDGHDAHAQDAPSSEGFLARFRSWLGGGES